MSHVYLVIGEHGILRATTSWSLAERIAEASEAVIAELPVLADHRRDEHGCQPPCPHGLARLDE